MIKKWFIQSIFVFLFLSLASFLIISFIYHYFIVSPKIKGTIEGEFKESAYWISKTISPSLINRIIEGEAKEEHKRINSVIKSFSKKYNLNKDSVIIGTIIEGRIVPLIHESLPRKIQPQPLELYRIFKIPQSKYVFAVRKGREKTPLSYFSFIFSLQNIVIFLISVVIGIVFIYYKNREMVRGIPDLIKKPESARTIYSDTSNPLLKAIADAVLFFERNNEILKHRIEAISYEIKVLSETSDEFKEAQKFEESLLKIKEYYDEAYFYKNKIKTMGEMALDEVEKITGSSSELIKKIRDEYFIDFKKRIDDFDVDSSQINSLTREFSKIIETIEEIAGEINLLSINATIEATSEGENQRFSVVASEIRRLSTDTKKATEQIKEIVEKIRGFLINFMDFHEGIRDFFKSISLKFDSLNTAIIEDVDLKEKIKANIKEALLLIEKVDSGMKKVEISIEDLRKEHATFFLKLGEFEKIVNKLNKVLTANIGGKDEK